MKLVTFVVGGVERFGFVIDHPATGEPWVFDPEETEARLYFYASRPTSPYNVNRPRFLADRPWPRSLTTFLALGDDGMVAVKRLQEYLLRFLEQSDQALLAGAGYPLDAVQLRAPIPRPRLYFGLVQNSPTFIRYNDQRPVVNVYPQGHQRPQGSLVSPGEPVYVPQDMGTFGWTPEPGLIIGRGGKNIAVADAMDHIAGFTLIMDLVHDQYTEQMMHSSGGQMDWFEDATGSWLGKKSDTLGAMGPYLTTVDEVGNPYDCLLYTRQSGWQRDRAHTGSMVIGFERVVSWLSSFITLHPGDVIHMGTLAVDGMPFLTHLDYGPEDYIEGEWEGVGTLRLPVVVEACGDWRAKDDPGRTIHPVPAVRDLIDAGTAQITTPDDWHLENVRHFWTVYGNYRDVEAVEGMAVRSLPRVLNCPVSALSCSGAAVEIPHRASELSVGVELAFVVNRIAHKVAEEEADDYVLGYLPLAVLHDTSFAEPIRQPASTQEAAMPVVYGRWADGFNIASVRPTRMSADAIGGRSMRLAVDEIGEITCNTDEYVLGASQVLAFLTQWITVFPGDVVTLGRTGKRLTVPADRKLDPETMLTASIEGIGEVHATTIDRREGRS